MRHKLFLEFLCWRTTQSLAQYCHVEKNTWKLGGCRVKVKFNQQLFNVSGPALFFLFCTMSQWDFVVMFCLCDCLVLHHFCFWLNLDMYLTRFNQTFFKVSIFLIHTHIWFYLFCVWNRFLSFYFVVAVLFRLILYIYINKLCCWLINVFLDDEITGFRRWNQGEAKPMNLMLNICLRLKGLMDSGVVRTLSQGFRLLNYNQ